MILSLPLKRASFIQPFCKIGLIPDSGGTYFLPRLIGLARAKGISMLGDNVSANDALAMGMVYKVCVAGQAYTKGLETAKHLATQPTKGLALMKKAFNESYVNTLDKQLELEEDFQRQAGKTHDYKEGVLAFCEKRDPQFRGE